MEIDGPNAFIDCIIAYSKNLETNSVSADLEVLMLCNAYDRIYSTNWEKEEKYCLMWQVRVWLMRSWQYACTSSALSNKVFLIVPSRSYSLISRMVTTIISLITLIDQKVFNRFKVNRLIVRKMKLVEYMFCKLISVYLTTNLATN